MELCKKIISHLKKDSYILKTDSDGITALMDLGEYESNLVIRKASQKFVSDAFDNRKTVPINTIHILLEAYFHHTNSYAAGVYIGKLKEFGIQKKDASIKILQKLFTPKQLGKILKGETKEIHDSMDILNKTDAYENGFYGKAPCGECGNWRVKLSQSYNWKTKKFDDPSLHCFKCLKDTTPPKVTLPPTVT